MSITFDYQGVIREAKSPNSAYVVTAWGHIRRLCVEIFKSKKHSSAYTRSNLRLNSLTPEEAEIAGEMAEDLIKIWNKYIHKVYGGNKDNEL